MSMYKNIINKLQAHFQHFKLNKPVSESELKKLKQLYPTIDNKSLLFYKQFNGFDCHLEDRDVGCLYSVAGIIEALPIILEPDEYPLIKSLVPIRGDGCGDYDVIFTNRGIGNGSILFWDHEIYEKPAYILSSAIDAYIQFLSAYLITCYDNSGVIRSEFNLPTVTNEPEYPWPFDINWMKQRDRGITLLLKDKMFSQLLEDHDL